LIEKARSETEGKMVAPGVTLFVCVSCRDGADADARPGALLLEALRARLEERNLAIAVEPVECLAVCKRPATIAFAGAGKWTYVVGDLAAGSHVDELIDSARSFAATDNGIVAWKDRPACFKKGVVSRTPPLP
jgi:predicted metal-binding protein